MVEHLSNNKSPIISFDGFANFVSPLSSEFFSQVKILLAIGNSRQIEYLKSTRDFSGVVPAVNHFVPTMSNVGVQVNDEMRSSERSQTKDKLTAFIESLSQKISEKSLPSINGANYSAKNSVFSNPIPNPPPQLRKTSDLLENLQQALARIPSSNAQQDVISPEPSNILSRGSDESSGPETPPQPEKFRILVEIEEAMHLPKVMYKKKRKNKNKGPSAQKVEIEPSAYATFEAITNITDENKQLLPPNITKSHEGYVFTTNVVERSSNPKWNKNFDIFLDVDIMKNVSTFLPQNL